MKVKIDSLERLAIKEGITDVDFDERQAILADMADEAMEAEILRWEAEAQIVASDEIWNEQNEGRLITQAMEAIESRPAPLGW